MKNLEVMKIKEELNKVPNREEVLNLLGNITPGVIESLINIGFNLYFNNPTLEDRFMRSAIVGATKAVLESPEYTEVIEFLKEE